MRVPAPIIGSARGAYDELIPIGLRPVRQPVGPRNDNRGPHPLGVVESMVIRTHVSSSNKGRESMLTD